MILGRYTHPSSACFDELDVALRAITDRTICLNAHFYEAPPGSIIYNLEDVGVSSNDGAFVVKNPQELWAGHEVWDFQPNTYGAKHVPLGHHPSFERFNPEPSPDIDIVFYGVLNPHRCRVLDGLLERGLKVVALPRCYGRERDGLLARAKLVLNMQYNVMGSWPSLRVAHLVSNRVPVLTEAHKDSWSFIPSCPYGEMVDVAEAMVRGPVMDRWESAAYALEEFRKMPLVLP